MENSEIVPTPAVGQVSIRRRIPILSGLVLPDWIRSLLDNRKATIGLAMMIFFILVAVFANQIAPTKNAARIVAKGNQPPNAQYVLGTSKQGQDIFAQLIHGTQISLTVGFLTGTIIILIAI